MHRDRVGHERLHSKRIPSARGWFRAPAVHPHADHVDGAQLAPSKTAFRRATAALSTMALTVYGICDLIPVENSQILGMTAQL